MPLVLLVSLYNRKRQETLERHGLNSGFQLWEHFCPHDTFLDYCIMTALTDTSVVSILNNLKLPQMCKVGTLCAQLPLQFYTDFFKKYFTSVLVMI